MHPFCGGLLSQQGGCDPIRGSGQIVYTLEVYTLLYSYISVKFVSLLIIARTNSRDVGCSAVLGWRRAFFYLEEFGQERETDCWVLMVFSLWGCCIVLFWVVGFILPAAVVGDSSMLYCFRMIIVKKKKNTLEDWSWYISFTLQTDILMIQYCCNAL